MKGYDNWPQKRIEVIQLWLCGMDVGSISGKTGVPKIRIRHEMEKLSCNDPLMQQRRAQSQYRSQRKKIRYLSAVMVIDPREQTRSIDRY